MAVSAIVFGGAFLTVLTAHAFEVFGGYAPCPLCLQERYAYYFAVPAAVVAFFAARGNSFGFARLVFVLIAIGFLINAGLGIYHAGAEWKWWPGPQTCSGAALAPISGNLLEALERARVVACDEAPWRMFGLSFAGWNAVVSAGLALVALLGVRNSPSAA